MENSRDAIVLAADLPDHAKIESRHPARAAELVSRLHEIINECVYASGGAVHDTIGSIAIAELPDPVAALACLERLHGRITEEAKSQRDLTPRVVMTAGEVHPKDFSIAGQAVQNGLSILDALQKNQILVSGDILQRGGVVPGQKALLDLGSTSYYTFPIERPAPPPQERAAQGGEAATSPTPEQSADGTVLPPPASPRRTWLWIAVAAVVLLLLAAVGYVIVTKKEPVAEVAAQPAAPAPDPGPVTIEISVREVSIAPEAGVDDTAYAGADAIIAALLGSAENVEISGMAPNVVGADLRMIVPEPTEPATGEIANPAAAQNLPVPDAPAPEAETRVVPWVERSGERFEGADAELDGLWSVVIPTVRWAGDQFGFDTGRMIPESQELRKAYAAVVADSSPATEAELTALHAALVAERDFLPGWLVLARSETESPALAPLILDGLRNVSRIMPGREDLARQLGRRELAEGTLAGAVEAFARVSAEKPGDDEAARVLALAALASHQNERFQHWASSVDDPRIHPADVQVTEGAVNQAVKKYYETEKQVSDNPYLSFKIGRIAVLRRSPQIAQIEIDKLNAQGVEPQRSFLRAYIAADEGNRAEAEAALAEALENASWADSPSFHAAEVRAILRDAPRTLSAIEQSVERREPMMHAITTNPLFGYLVNESRFREATRKLLEYQRNIGASLAEHSSQ